MTVLEVKTSPSAEVQTKWFETLEKALPAFKEHDKAGHFCAIFNMK